MLWNASRDGDVNACIEAIKKGANASAPDPEMLRNTPLHYAALLESPETAALLVKYVPKEVSAGQIRAKRDECGVEKECCCCCCCC
jgi:hypothetical protein